MAPCLTFATGAACPTSRQMFRPGWIKLVGDAQRVTEGVGHDGKPPKNIVVHGLESSQTGLSGIWDVLKIIGFIKTVFAHLFYPNKNSSMKNGTLTQSIH